MDLEVARPNSGALFFFFLANVQLLVFENLEMPSHKTKNIVNYVKEMEDVKKILLVDGGPIEENLKLATQNLHYVNVLPSIVSFLVAYTLKSYCQE